MSPLWRNDVSCVMFVRQPSVNLPTMQSQLRCQHVCCTCPVDVQVSVRVMDIDQFMNSKRLFKDIRNRSKDKQPAKPVTVHVNYHPGDWERGLGSLSLGLVLRCVRLPVVSAATQCRLRSSF